MPARPLVLWFLHLACCVFASESVCSAEKPELPDKAWLEANYTKFEHRIPMRDGVKLFTAVYAPKEQSIPYPILMRRTPYSVQPYGADFYPDLGDAAILQAKEKFIMVFQDVRGRNGSEGQYVHVRPIRSAETPPGEIDESTDAWDTIDWLVSHVPNNNGKVGLCGISYPGFYAACGAIDSHPALKAVSPQAPIADWFLGDDWHHNGALYLPHAFGFLQSFEQKLAKPTREKPRRFDYETPDGYEFFLNLGPLSNADTKFFKGTIPFWTELMQHDTYDDFWKARNLRPRLKGVRAAVMTVGGWFDAEDLSGTLHVYRSIEAQNAGIFNVLVMGPWSHGQWERADGQALGHVSFRARTAEFYREHIELKFFKRFLKDDKNVDLPEAFVFETGTCQWRRFDAWPPRNVQAQSLFLRPGGSLSFDGPDERNSGFDEYVSDPLKPAPYIANIANGMTQEHMLDDQRFASTRTDVLVYRTDILEEDLTIAGPITASLTVSTTGTDSDWIVKLIDVYPGDFPNPDPNPAGVQMGGYQQLVRGEPMRGKFRNSFDRPEPFEPGQPTKIEWVLPDAFHTFRRGHRLMVQVQSSWFPLIDRNPQTFCNINAARSEDFRKATQRVYLSSAAPSLLRVHVLPIEMPKK